MLWVELVMFLQPECIIKKSKNRKEQKRNIFWSSKAKGIYELYRKVSRKLFLFYLEVMSQNDPSVFLSITVQRSKSKKVFASKIYME